MGLIESYSEGQPCWADLLTEDLDVATAFYSALFSWTFELAAEQPDPKICPEYLIASLHGDPVAGIGRRPEHEDFGPAWIPYFHTGNADSAAMRITAAGGQLVIGPAEVRGPAGLGGRIAIAGDPAGAGFGIWEDGLNRGSQRMGEAGALAWRETITGSAAEVREFYQAVFGWSYKQIGNGQSFDYTVASIGGEVQAGIMALPESAAEQLPSYWMNYFQVDDTDASATLLHDLGGSAITDPQDSPQGRFAIVQDPLGAVLTLVAP